MSSTNPPFIEAAEKGDVALVSQILEQGADINQREYGWTALILAAEKGHETIVKHLIEKGAEINRHGWRPSMVPGLTALMAAASNGHETIVKHLLEKHDR